MTDTTAAPDTLAVSKTVTVEGSAAEADVQAQAQQFRDMGWQSVTVTAPKPPSQPDWTIQLTGFS
ncbi:hypothetical protein HHL28_16630 [Aerophototrophica crusticola]|uniref:Uncharacterized protein n=1 Tax=Aerophototrophica crusticola TaxID=1709002 RepID=A0A858RBD0_9PROT|nr:hypothetical protein HHL28_16630 [Rhodospirillaceae bacterium B3]